MNINKKSINLIYAFLLMVIFISSYTVNAEKFTSPGGSKPSGYASQCESYLGMEIEDGEYTPNSPRQVRMKCDKSCRYIVYEAGYEELDVIKKKYLETSSKGTSFSGETTYSIGKGREALVIVVANKTELQHKVKKKIKVKDKDGKEHEEEIEEWEPVKSGDEIVYCKKGKYNTESDEDESGESSGDEDLIHLTGNAVAMFVQNPADDDQDNTSKSCDNCTNACSTAKKGIHTENSSFNSSNSDDPSGWKNFYNKLLSYCEKRTVPFVLSETKLEDISNNTLEAYYYFSKLSKKNDNSEYDAVKGEIDRLKTRDGIKVYSGKINAKGKYTGDRDKLKGIGLECDKKTVDPSTKEYLYYETEDIDATLKSSKDDKYTINVCNKICYEHLTVKYDPPATVKAGLCFSYKVTVKSVSKCGVKNQFDLNKVRELGTCNLLPICSNQTSHTQAGPNEDFDRCISECDGGKYSQSCINSCYDKVYNKKESSTTNRKTSRNSIYDYKIVSTVNNLADNSKNTLTYLKYSKKDLENYYKESNSAGCSTEKIKSIGRNRAGLEKCAKYFFEAKALDPHGEYKEISGKNKYQWKPDSSIDKNAGITNSTTHIPMQIGRASPWYLRSVSSTTDLLYWLLEPTDKTGFWRKYVIDSNGIKRQYSSRYHCDEKCHYRKGKCSTGIYDAKTYAKILKENYEELASKLKNCATSSSCDTEETTTSYDIKITTNTNSDVENVDESETNNTTKYIYPTASGKTNIHSSTPAEVTYKDGTPADNMFTPANDDKDTTTGILGKCFDGRSNPHYQTTITYPGTYINMKTAERKYGVPSNKDEYYLKNGYYCTPYNEVDVNEKYWAWVVYDKKDPNKYPTGFNPEYNIETILGKQNAGVGKYNWQLDFKCFYSSYNAGGDSDDPTCDKGHPDYPNCNKKCKNLCECNSSTRFCNTKFRVIDSSNMFPDKNGEPLIDSSDSTANKKTAKATLPFNWTSKAQDNDTKDETEYKELKAKGYTINPEKYREAIQNQGSDKSFSNDSSNIMYRVHITKDGINQIKNYTKENGFTSYKGTFKPLTSNGKTNYYYMAREVENMVDINRVNAHYGENTHKGYNGN